MVETVKLEVTLRGLGHGDNVTSEQHTKAVAERVCEALSKSLHFKYEDNITVAPYRGEHG